MTIDAILVQLLSFATVYKIHYEFFFIFLCLSVSYQSNFIIFIIIFVLYSFLSKSGCFLAQSSSDFSTIIKREGSTECALVVNKIYNRMILDALENFVIHLGFVQSRHRIEIWLTTTGKERKYVNFCYSGGKAFSTAFSTKHNSLVNLPCLWCGTFWICFPIQGLYCFL